MYTGARDTVSFVKKRSNNNKMTYQFTKVFEWLIIYKLPKISINNAVEEFMDPS